MPPLRHRHSETLCSALFREINRAPFYTTARVGRCTSSATMSARGECALLSTRLDARGSARAARRWRAPAAHPGSMRVAPYGTSAAAVCAPRPRDSTPLGRRDGRAFTAPRAISQSAPREASESYLEVASRPSRFEESSWGPPEITEILLQTMRIQWAHGYPDTPRGYPRFTHGFHEYPAGMQAAAADRCLDCLPGDSLFDPFCGSGTSVVVGMTRGYAGFGVDVSPLAAYVAAHRSWRPSRGVETLEAMRVTAKRAAANVETAARLLAEERKDEDELSMDGCDSRDGPRDWRPVRRALFDCLDSSNPETLGLETGVPGALWFCLSVALQRSQKSRGKRRRPYARQRTRRAESETDSDSARGAEEVRVSTPGQREAGVAFVRVVDEYCDRIGEFMAATARGDATVPDAVVYNKDVRDVTLPRRVDAVLTSPPYPGVYDYLSFARKVRAGSGAASKVAAVSSSRESDRETLTEGSDAAVAGSEGYFRVVVPEDRHWPSEWTRGEIGARRSLRSDPHAFKESWQKEQEAWLRVVSRSLKPGGRAAVMLGDGANIDTQKSILDAGAVCGLRGVAAVTMALTRETADGLVWNAARKEHLVLLEKPL